MTATTSNLAKSLDEPPPAPRKTRTTRLPFYRNCRQALAMLTLAPVFATPVPRLSVEPRSPDGGLRVLDRATGERYLIYTPRFRAQFQSGHIARMWYVRPVANAGVSVQSRAFPTAHGAIESVREGRWRPAGALAPGRARWPRVIWSPALASAG
jgi:hypothetical protein